MKGVTTQWEFAVPKLLWLFVAISDGWPWD